MYIEVDYLKFKEPVSEIENYLQVARSKIGMMDQTVTSLGSIWRGDDYDQFRKEWNEVVARDSTNAKTMEALNGYADALEKAEETYRQVQARALNRAITLCK